MRRVWGCVVALLGAVSVAGAGPAPDLEAKTQAFLERPEQIEAIKAALVAQARSLPRACPDLVVTPAELFLAEPPVPLFDDHGTMVEGNVRQRFSSSGCGTFHPMFNLWVIAAPGEKIRTVAGYPGTTTASLELQQTATPIATVAAGRVLGGCGSVDVLDTKDLGADSSEAPGARWEAWLAGGCGMFAQVTLHFVPDPARDRTRVEVPPAGVLRINLR